MNLLYRGCVSGWSCIHEPTVGAASNDVKFVTCSDCIGFTRQLFVDQLLHYN